jgi:hypothetical protein
MRDFQTFTLSLITESLNEKTPTSETKRRAFNQKRLFQNLQSKENSKWRMKFLSGLFYFLNISTEMEKFKRNCSIFKV